VTPGDLFQVGKDGALILRVRVEPRSSRPGVAGVQGGLLKIRLSAPPVEGKANGELVRMVGKMLRVKKSQVTISAGETSRQKTLRISGVEPAALREWLRSVE